MVAMCRFVGATIERGGIVAESFEELRTAKTNPHRSGVWVKGLLYPLSYRGASRHFT
jgi:hypothetical protein